MDISFCPQGTSQTYTMLSRAHIGATYLDHEHFLQSVLITLFMYTITSNEDKMNTHIIIMIYKDRE